MPILRTGAGGNSGGTPLPPAPTGLTVVPTRTFINEVESLEYWANFIWTPQPGVTINFYCNGSLIQSGIDGSLGIYSGEGGSGGFAADEYITASLNGVESLPSNVFFVPAAPTVTSAVVTNATTIAVTSTGSGVVEWQTTTDGSTFTTNALTSANGNLTVADSSLITGVEVSDSGSWFSIPVEPLPTTPGDFAVVPTVTYIQGDPPVAYQDGAVSWTYDTDPNGGFRLGISDDGVTWPDPSIRPGNSRSTTVTFATPSADKYFRISAIVDGIDSPQSNIVHILAAPTIDTAEPIPGTTNINVAATGPGGESEWGWIVSVDDGATWYGALTEDGNLLIVSSGIITHYNTGIPPTVLPGNTNILVETKYIKDGLDSWLSAPSTVLTCPDAPTLDSVTNLQADGNFSLSITLNGVATAITDVDFFIDGSSYGSSSLPSPVTLPYDNLSDFIGEDVSVQVDVTNASGASAKSNAIDSHVTLPAPTTPAATDNGDGSYHWSCDAITEADSYLNYTDDVVGDGSATNTGDQTTSNGAHTVTIAAVDAMDIAGAKSSGVPVTVTTLTAGVIEVDNPLIAPTSITLDVSTPASGGVGTRVRTWYFSDVGNTGPWTAFETDEPENDSQTKTGLTPLTQYWFYSTVTDDNSNSADTAVVNGTTLL